MRASKIRIWTWLFALVLVQSGGMISQEAKKPSDGELKAEVPELTAFHEVIFKIWHTAWPDKNAAMLRELSRDVEELGEKLCAAKLPGILREKQPAWDVQIGKMKSALADYKGAAAGNDNDKLLKSAEVLHAQYEAMVRILRPIVREVDEFHAVLYPLYHYYAPQKDTAEIRKSVVLLRQKMEKIKGVVLAGRWKEKQAKFEEARQRLEASLTLLEKSLAAPASDDWYRQIETVHSGYENLTRVFE